MQNNMQFYAPPPDLKTFIRVGGKVGVYVGLVAAFLYMCFTGLILFFLADLVIPVIGWIEDILFAIAAIVCSGIGGSLGMLVGFFVWCIAASFHKQNHP